MQLTVPAEGANSYRNKVKGYHLAFNVHEPPQVEGMSKYQYKPLKQVEHLSAEEIKERVQAAKNKRLELKKQKEEEEKLKYANDRKELRRIHEKLRQQKISQMLGNEQIPPSIAATIKSGRIVSNTRDASKKLSPRFRAGSNVASPKGSRERLANGARVDNTFDRVSPAKVYSNIHDGHTQKRGNDNNTGSGNYQLSIEEMFKGKPMTFEDIDRLNYEAFTTKGGALKRNANGKNTITKDDNEFRPSDILDLDDD